MKLAVIPARGGSKRVPRKNIRPFLGRPIIEYSIEAARDCGLFDTIIVSTDDAEIARVARAAGADVPFLRPPELADDFAGTNEVVRHAVSWFQEHGRAFDAVCCIYATAPLLTPEALRAGYAALVERDAAFAFSVTRFPSPVQRALRLSSSGKVSMMHPQFATTRSQDLEQAWHDAAQFYWGRPAAFLARESLYAGAAVGVPLPPERVQDIDTEADWRRAERMFLALRTDESQ